MAKTREAQLAFLFTNCEAMKDERNYSGESGDLFDDDGNPFDDVLRKAIAGAEANGWHLIGVFHQPLADMLHSMNGAGATVRNPLADLHIHCLSFDELLDMESTLTEAVSYCVTHPLPNAEDDPDFDDIVNNAAWFQQWTDTSTAAQRVAKSKALFPLATISV